MKRIVCASLCVCGMFCFHMWKLWSTREQKKWNENVHMWTTELSVSFIIESYVLHMWTFSFICEERQSLGKMSSSHSTSLSFHTTTTATKLLTKSDNSYKPFMKHLHRAHDCKIRWIKLSLNLLLRLMTKHFFFGYENHSSGLIHHELCLARHGHIPI